MSIKPDRLLNISIIREMTRLRGALRGSGARAFVLPSPDFLGRDRIPPPWALREWQHGFNASIGIMALHGRGARLWLAGPHLWEQAEASLKGTGIELALACAQPWQERARWVRGATSEGRLVMDQSFRLLRCVPELAECLQRESISLAFGDLMPLAGSRGGQSDTQDVRGDAC